MKILFRADAGPGIGSGHVMRSLALAQRAMDKGSKAALLTIHPDAPAVEGWRNEGAEIIAATAERGSISDAQETAAIARRLECNWVVADGYAFTREWQANIKAAGPGLAVIDDIGGDGFAADMVVNQNPGANAGLYPGCEGRLLLGAEYVMLRRDIRHIEREPHKPPPHILVTFGGYDPDNLALKAIEGLGGLDASFSVTIVCAADKSGLEKVRQAADKQTIPERQFEVLTPTPLAPLMARADLALCAGGTTSLEMASAGIPMVLLAIADNQEPGVRALEDAGCARLAGRGGDVMPRAIECIRILLSDSSARKNMHRAGRTLVDGKGVEKVCEQLEYGRSPFDLEAAEGMVDWRNHLAWPISHEARKSILEEQYRSVIDFVFKTDDDDLRDVLLLGVQAMMNPVRMATETALAIQRQVESGIILDGSQPELLFLQNGGDFPDPGEKFTPVLAGPKHKRLRRLARMASWAPWWKLPATILAPEAVAVSHNHLLCETARKEGRRVAFRHGDEWLAKIRRGPKKSGFTPDIEGAAEGLSIVLTDLDELEEPWKGRLREIVLAYGKSILPVACDDIAKLRNYKNLPYELWAGSGGYYPVRALSIEVLRRGGKVRHFDHGGATGFTDDPCSPAFAEYAVASEYVVSTPRVASMVEEIGSTELASNLHDIKITGQNGDPTFSGLDIRPQSGSQRPRVAYVPTALVGSRQLYRPLLPDLIYLDWQLRLAGMIGSLQVGLTCHPHPESLLLGGRRVLEDVAPLSNKPLVALMKETDVLVFDYPSTTALYEAMCTHLPVVFIDLGFSGFPETAKTLIENRCRIVPATFDSRNRPQIDPAMLAAAITEKPGAEDPAPLRRVLAGLN